MNIVFFIRLILRNLKWLITLPLVAAITVFLLTGDLPKVYTSSTTIYTGIASGYDITTSGNSKLDRNAVNNAFDNLITTINSRQTTEEVALQLLTQHILLEEPDLRYLAKKGFNQLHQTLSDSLINELKVPGNFEATLEKVVAFKESGIKNPIRSLVDANGGFYSVKQISSNLKPKRFSNSDMVQIDFASTDAGVAQNTLIFMVETFMRRFQNLKGSETSDVVAYFERQLASAQEKLNAGEEKLKQFGIDNRIINYEMQTKYIAEYKERLESELYKHRMQMESAKAAILRLEHDLEELNIQLENNQALNQKRLEYSQLNKLLSNAKLYNSKQSEIDSLSTEKLRLEGEMKDVIQKFHNYKHSIQGIETQKVLDQWLLKLIEFEEYQASLEVFTQRKKEFDEIYDEFAPLGSTLNKLDRQVGILEQQYLSILHGLNMAKLKQQSIELSNSISILDKPFFPVHAAASKRMLMIAVSAIGVGFLILVIIFLKAFLDASIQSPEKASEFSKLPLIGALPLDEPSVRKSIKMEETQEALLEQMISSLVLKLRQFEQQHYTLIFYSLRPEEGKSYAAQKLLKRLTAINGSAMYLYPDSGSTANLDDFDRNKVLPLPYQIPENLIKIESAQDLVPNTITPENKEEYAFTVVEIPTLNKYSIPTELVRNANLSILIIDAQRTWSVADDHLQALYASSIENSACILLNKTKPDYLENLLGDIPKPRSLVRIWIKKILTLQLSNS